MLQASFHAKYPWVGVGWNKMDKMWIVVDAGGWAHGVYYTALCLWMWIFFSPIINLKKKNTKQPKTSYCLCLESSLWRAVTMDSTRFSPGSCTHVDEEGWDARAVQGCVSFPGLLYSVLQTQGPKATEIYSLEILKAYKSELEVSAASLWATRGGSFLPPLAGNPWGSWLPDCTPPVSASVITWPSPRLSSCGLPSVCLSPALFSRLPRTHP